jgi:hypothetical protein
MLLVVRTARSVLNVSPHAVKTIARTAPIKVSAKRTVKNRL